MAKPVNLPAALVLEKGRAAYEARKLSAQNGGACAYRSLGGHPCIIGAALSRQRAVYFDGLADGTIERLMLDGHVVTDNPDLLIQLQGAHDAWAGGKRQSAEDELRALLGLPTRKAGQ